MRHLYLLAVAASVSAFAQVGNLQLSTSSMNFSAVLGNSLPQSQIFGVSSTGVALPVNVTVTYFSGTEGWLTATPDSPNTPSNVTVTVNSSGLSAGTYNARVGVVASGSQSGFVTVTFTVTATNPGGSAITASPASVSLSSIGGNVAQATVTLASTGFIPFQVFVNTTSGGNWLSYIAASSTSPTSITVNANPAGLAAGVYTGTVSVAPSTGIAGVAIPVTFTVGTAGGTDGLTLSPNTLSFIYQTGTANPSAQSTFITNFNSIVGYSASASVGWARMTSNNNAIPAQTVTGTTNTSLTVYVDPTGLSPGFYSGTIVVSAANGLNQNLAINLTVSGSSLLAASPSSFVFNYNPDAGIPASQQTVISATGGSVAYTAAANSAGWLLVGPQTGSTGGSNILTVSVNPTGLVTGTHTGTVVVSSGSNTLSIPVTLVVGTSSFNSISASPSTVVFQSQLGSPSASQTLFLTSTTAKSFLASVSTSGGNWLQVTPNNGITPASLTVSITPLAVTQAGTYNGVIQISNLSDNTQLAIPVSMTLSGSTLTASPQSLSFSLSSGSTTTATQAVVINGTAGGAFTTTTDSNWITVSPNAGSIPATINITASAAGLGAGNYSGIVTVNSAGVTANIAVSLAVTTSAAPVLTPAALTFQYTPGSAIPGAQAIAVNSTFGTMNFTATARTSFGGNWLNVASNSNLTPATLSVTVNPAGLAAGTYRGTILVTTFAGSDSRSADVTLVVTAPAGPSLRTALHGAMRELSAITPGMILSLQGSALGPVTGVNGTVTAAGAFETTLNGFRVLFDGVPAPILYSSDTRMDVVAPYAIAGRTSSRVQVENAASRSETLDLQLSPDAAPGIFSLDGSGRGQAAALNENGTVNGPANPAPPSSVLVFYATGEGQTRPGGQDGRIIATDIRVPVLPVVVNIGGVPVQVLYAGSAPNQVSGLMQVNVRLNADVPRGTAIPLELRVGPAPSQSRLTVAIQ